ncbi:Variable outer membrane protein (plasmid) [Borrelia miyamotoi FR64b]|nr:Variable outer membrane protein [Borrelia miyamotoi FR64b]
MLMAGDDKKADDLGSRTANSGDGESGKLFGNAVVGNSPKNQQMNLLKLLEWGGAHWS